jgi:hypothetical protein
MCFFWRKSGDKLRKSQCEFALWGKRYCCLSWIKEAGFVFCLLFTFTYIYPHPVLLLPSFRLHTVAELIFKAPQLPSSLRSKVLHLIYLCFQCSCLTPAIVSMEAFNYKLCKTFWDHHVTMSSCSSVKYTSILFYKCLLISLSFLGNMKTC